MTKYDLGNLVGNLIDAAVALFLIYTAYLFLLKLTGHSPTVEEILLTLTAGLILEILRIEYRLGKIDATLEHLGKRQRRK